MATSGGFVAPGFLLSRLPEWTLFGDGRVMIPASYTGNIPVVPQLIVMRLGPPEIQKIVAAADKAGLLGPDASFDAVGIADAGTTVFTTVVGGRVHIISAYALGMTQTVDTTPAGVERAKLADFQNELLNLPSFLDRSFGSELFEPAGLRVFLTDAGPADASQPTPRTIAWPLASDPAKVAQQTAVPGTTCVAVIGADVATFEAAARNADGQTVWTYGSARYSLGVRPMFPNETGCAGGTL
jgi:hypothetical protein